MNKHPEHPDRFGVENSASADSLPESTAEALRAYHDVPLSERNWRRDAAFPMLARTEQKHELIEEALRDLKSLSVTIRHAILDDARQRRLRDLLAEVDMELKKDQYNRL
jgi:hypothetical protein